MCFPLPDSSRTYGFRALLLGVFVSLLATGDLAGQDVRKAVAPAPIAKSPRPSESSRGNWYKGNLHTHSLWSDGNDYPEMIAAWYEQRGYHFLTLSDHNILSRGERWIAAEEAEKRGAIQALDRYLQRFGEDWVETREVDGQLQVRLKPLAEFRDRLEEPEKFLMIEAEEITDHFGSLPIHINATNLDEKIRPQGGDSVAATIDNNLQAVENQSRKLNRPILAHLNHPNFGWAVTPSDLAQVTRERFFEVFNGHPSVRQLGDEQRVSIERMWDIVNTLRLVHFDSVPLFGVATDDAHHYFGGQGATPGKGWVWVRAERLDPTALIDAMEAGDFYASSGVTLREVTWDPDTRELTVEVDADDPAAEADTNYTLHLIGTRRKVGEQLASAYEANPAEPAYPEGIGEVIQTQTGTVARFRVPDDLLYARVRIDSDRPHPNPSWDNQVEQAWTQPVGWR